MLYKQDAVLEARGGYYGFCVVFGDAAKAIRA